ncbi:MAG: hypothetical protein JWM91_1196 [Rhodospirillales bacterium]|nr:hypothetical protein [Rhodospirillales bacterium]
MGTRGGNVGMERRGQFRKLCAKLAPTEPAPQNQHPSIPNKTESLRKKYLSITTAENVERSFCSENA